MCSSDLHAWATLARASRAHLRPGDRLLLRRSGRWHGLLRIASDGLPGDAAVVGAYGRGRRPRLTGGCVEVAGSDVVVQDLATRGCDWWGVHVLGDRVTVRRVLSAGNIAGISIDRGADDVRVVDDLLIDNDRLAPGTDGPDDDYGANGVEVLGDRAVIARNLIIGSVAPSPDYGQDGSAIEIYEAVGTRVRDNLARDNLTFTELGSELTADTRYDDNTVRSSVPDSSFLITRGPGDAWGPVFGTVALGNDVLLSGRGSFLTWCGGTCGSDVLDLTGNLLRLGRDRY